MFKGDEATFTRMAKTLMGRVKDRHNRFLLVDHFRESQGRVLTSIKSQLGQALSFNFFNPSGHYRLNLAVPE